MGHGVSPRPGTRASRAVAAGVRLRAHLICGDEGPTAGPPACLGTGTASLLGVLGAPLADWEPPVHATASSVLCPVPGPWGAAGSSMSVSKAAAGAAVAACAGRSRVRGESPATL